MAAETSKTKTDDRISHLIFLVIGASVVGVFGLIVIVGFLFFMFAEVQRQKVNQNEMATQWTELNKLADDLKANHLAHQRKLVDQEKRMDETHQELITLKDGIDQRLSEMTQKEVDKVAEVAIEDPVEKESNKGRERIKNEAGITVKEIEALGKRLGRDLQMPCLFQEINNRWRGVLGIDGAFVGFFVTDKNDNKFEFVFVQSQFYGEFLLGLKQNTPIRLTGNVDTDGGKNTFFVSKIELIK